MTNDVPQISEREREILRLVAMGATNQQIAQQLHISINTVKVHLRNIFDKIGVASRTEATVCAIRLGLVQLESQPKVVASVPGDPPHEPEPPPSETPAAAVMFDEESLSSALAQTTDLDGAKTRVAETRPASSSATARRTVLLSVLAAFGVLLAAISIYFVSQRQPAPTSATQATTSSTEINHWKQHAVWPQPRSDFAVAAYDGKLYTIGGTGPSGPSAAVDRFDPAQNQWVQLNEKPTPTTHVQAATIGGRIYVPGGEDVGGAALTVFEAYDPRNKQWETLPPLPAPRSRYALASFEGKLYLFGGWDGNQARREVFEYDPAHKQWTERAPLPTARSDAGAALVADHIYVIGGKNEQGALRVNERFDPNGGDSAWESVVPLASPVATPAVVGTVNSVLVFDPQRSTAAQYSPDKDSWTPPLAIPAGIAISSRALPLSTSIFLFGPPVGKAAGAISEYQASYQTLFPLVGTGQ